MSLDPEVDQSHFDEYHRQPEAGMTSGIHVYYSRRAGEYERICAKPARQPDLRAMESWLPVQLSNRRILELACGTGYWTQFVAPVVRSIVAIDAAPEPLEIARRRIRDNHVSFLLGDAYRVPPDIGSFDAAFAGFWFSHVPRSRRCEFLLQFNSLLESGSPVITFDNLYVEGSSTPIAEWDDEATRISYERLRMERFIASLRTSQRSKNSFPS
ncbi:MAG: class I SAM-dependent methyltransferase [Steroidobacteraceae bacterium]